MVFLDEEVLELILLRLQLVSDRLLGIFQNGSQLILQNNTHVFWELLLIHLMHEKKGGLIHGKHKTAKDENKMREEVLYAEKLWDDLKLEDVLKGLDRMKKKKEAI